MNDFLNYLKKVNGATRGAQTNKGREFYRVFGEARTPEEQKRVDRRLEIAGEVQGAKPEIEAAGKKASEQGKNVAAARRQALKDLLGIRLPEDPTELGGENK